MFFQVIANQDKSSKLIGRLRSRIAELEAELLDFKQVFFRFKATSNSLLIPKESCGCN